MYESNNGFNKWKSSQMEIVKPTEEGPHTKAYLAIGFLFLLAAALKAHGIDTIECVQNFSSGVTCSNNVIGFNLHRHVPSDTTSYAIWSDGIDVLSGRAGVAWTPGEGLKFWSSYFTDGLKEYFLNIH